MELRQLEYFMAVCKELHFTRAAESLNISQPSLSQQIKHLEGVLGTPLFDRMGRKIAMTEAGEILLAHSKQIFYELEQARAALQDLNGLQRGKLTIGSLITCTNYLLPPAILEFKRLYPNVELSVLGMRSGKITEKVMENELDIGISFLPVKNEEIESIPLFTEELSLAVPSDHPLAMLEEINMSLLEDVPIVSLPKDYCLRRLIDKSCAEIGITLKPTLEMTTLDSVIQMVNEGIGVTILPKPYLDFMKNENVTTVKLINPTPKREVGFIYRKDKFMCHITKKFIHQIEEMSQVFQLN